MRNTYSDLLKYYVDNEFDVKENDPHNYLESIKNDTKNEMLLSEIENLFTSDDETEYLSELPTGVIKDMFVYYTKHSK